MKVTRFSLILYLVENYYNLLDSVMVIVLTIKVIQSLISHLTLQNVSYSNKALVHKVISI